MRHCVQSFLRLTEEWRIVTDVGGGYPADIWSMHRAVAGFSSIALDVTQLGQRQGGSFTCTCKGCKRVEFLVRELAELREMFVGMKRTVTGHGLEEKGGETGDREVGLEEQEKGEGFLASDKGEITTEEGEEICAGATIMATHAYTRNPESPLGKEIDLQQCETVIFKGEHAENEYWRLVEDRNGQVGYAPAAFLVIILDTIAEEEESGATKKGEEDSTEENHIGGWIGQEGKRRKSYSAAVIDGIKRNSRIYVGDSIVRKTDTRLSRGRT